LTAPQPYTLGNTAITGAPVVFSSDVRLASFFGQAQGTLWHQLTLTAALRDDGTSTFGLDKQFSLFPKGSLAWNVIRDGDNGNKFLTSVKPTSPAICDWRKSDCSARLGQQATRWPIARCAWRAVRDLDPSSPIARKPEKRAVNTQRLIFFEIALQLDTGGAKSTRDCGSCRVRTSSTRLAKHFREARDQLEQTCGSGYTNGFSRNEIDLATRAEPGSVWGSYLPAGADISAAKIGPDAWSSGRPFEIGLIYGDFAQVAGPLLAHFTARSAASPALRNGRCHESGWQNKG
jgi:hypothetical protein